MFFDPDGSEVDWIVGYGPPPEEYQKKVDNVLQGVDTFKSVSARYAANPKDAAVVFKLAQKWGDRYDREKSAEKFKEVIALDPDGKQGTTEYRKEPVSFTQMAEFNLGQSALQSRPADPAPLLAFVKKYPESSLVQDAYGRLAGAYFGRSAPKADAAKFFEEYTTRYPREYMAVSAWVRRIIQDKEPLDKGLELAEKAVGLAPSPIKTVAFQNVAEIYLLQGNKAKAAETAETLIQTEVERQKNPPGASAGGQAGAPMVVIAGGRGGSAGSATYLLTAARIFIESDKKDRALAVFGPETLKTHMQESQVLSGYAQFWLQQNTNLESALIAAQKGAELAPNEYRGWSLLSQVQLRLKSYEDALKSAEKAMALAPAQPSQLREGIKRSIDQIKSAMQEKK